MKIEIVIAHHNQPEKLEDTLELIKDRASPDFRYIIIDNGSEKTKINRLNNFLDKGGFSYQLIRRKNCNREAGAYWYYLNNLFVYSPDKIVLFTQEELHTFPMSPKGRNALEDGKPFYPHEYRSEDIDLLKCWEYLTTHAYDQIGFGGRLEEEDIKYSARWRYGYWQKRFRELGISNFEFFSGACFAMHAIGIRDLIANYAPSPEDYENEYFPWVWERLWGSSISHGSGALVHYGSYSTDVYVRKTLGQVRLGQLKGFIRRLVPFRFLSGAA